MSVNNSVISLIRTLTRSRAHTQNDLAPSRPSSIFPSLSCFSILSLSHSLRPDACFPLSLTRSPACAPLRALRHRYSIPHTYISVAHSSRALAERYQPRKFREFERTKLGSRTYFLLLHFKLSKCKNFLAHKMIECRI